MSATSTIIDPKTLTPAATQQLTNELYATHIQVFDGVSKSDFANYVINSPAERTRIQVYRDGPRVIGYLAVHTFVRTIQGQRWVVVRAEAGKLPAYRRAAQGTLLIAEVLRICLRYPRAHKAMLGCFVHPSAYVAIGHVAPQIYPHWREPTPANVQIAMTQLASDFGLAPVDHDRAGVRNVGWITRETQADRDSWARRLDPMTRTFCEQNPGYQLGHGLVVLLPISMLTLIDSSLRHLRRELGRRFAKSQIRTTLAA